TEILVYVVSCSGALGKSVTGLCSPIKPPLCKAPHFTLLSDQTKSLSVGAVALENSTPTPTIFVGTGAPDNSANVAGFTGTGILISRDGGNSWTLVESADSGKRPFAGLGFSNFLVDPHNPSIVVASTGFPVDGNFPYTSLPQGNQGIKHLGIYRSQDSGRSWTQVMSVQDPQPLLPPGGFFHIDLLYEPTTGS